MLNSTNKTPFPSFYIVVLNKDLSHVDLKDDSVSSEDCEHNKLCH